MDATIETIATKLSAVPPPGVGDRVITGLACDSRAVQPGDLYVALPGRMTHGAAFGVGAVSRGAVAAVSDRPVDGLPTIVVADPRGALGPLAAWFFDHPSIDLPVIGVTGTNGKTTTVYMIDAGLGGAAGVISTVENRAGTVREPSVRTTPEAPQLQRLLAAMRDNGCPAAAVEVSSHALSMGRVDGTHFAAAVFTNLSHDHLDFHHDMDAYFEVKRALFTPARCDAAVVNLDDLSGRRLAAGTSCKVIGFSAAGHPDASWNAGAVTTTSDGTSFRLTGAGVDLLVTLRLLGRHNVHNALGAIAALAATGHDPEMAVDGIQQLCRVPGRMETIDARTGVRGIVDYAHNADGLHRALDATRAMTDGRVIVVFGAPGDRDTTKRPTMGAIAAELADVVIVTTDDPWSEDPAHIAAAVLDGARRHRPHGVELILDRRAAIAHAVDVADSGDIILVAGRGHETVQTFPDGAVSFDDRAVLAEELARRFVDLRADDS